jgi:N-dimethylarginine dimethylaminohydrolase
MLSKNEWGRLRSVIIGTASGAQIPPLDRSLRIVNYADVSDARTIPTGPYPQVVIDEANEDLQRLSDLLESLDIIVHRPDDNHPTYYNYCPRDSVLIAAGKMIATPQPLASRKNEYRAFAHHLTQYGGVVNLTVDHPGSLYNDAAVGDKDTLALTEVAPAFDAANVLRANDDLFYLVSNGGNKAGANLLQEIVGDKAKVWPIEGIYSYMHIDSTIAFLREGLMLLNPERVKSKDQLPKPLRSWDVIWAPEPVDIGCYPGYRGASKWMNINLLSITPQLVILEERQTNLRDALEEHGIESVMMPGRHQRTLSGGFHCVSLDIERDE